jgi:carbon monoxide dehydrogenase subunit G
VTVEDVIEIAKPQELVYALVRDLERALEWQPSLESVDVHSGTEVRRVAGVRQEAKFFVVEDDPPRRFAIATEGGPVHARATFELEPDGDGTRVAFTMDFELHGRARFAGRFARAAARREVRSSLQKLKEVAEG